MVKKPIQLLLNLNDRSGTEIEDLADLTYQLRQELLELDIETVDWVYSGEIPSNAKTGEPIIWGELLVTLVASNSMITMLVIVLRSWLNRHDRRSLSLEINGNKLEVTGISSIEQQQLINTWINYCKNFVEGKYNSEHQAPRTAAGIPSNLYSQLRTDLVVCGSFDTDGELNAIFVEERLAPWQNRLPRADNLSKRVEGVINFLYHQYDDLGQNALVLLLCVLSENFDSRDACHHRLVTLAKELELQVKEAPKLD